MTVRIGWVVVVVGMWCGAAAAAPVVVVLEESASCAPSGWPQGRRAVTAELMASGIAVRSVQAGLPCDIGPGSRILSRVADQWGGAVVVRPFWSRISDQGCVDIFFGGAPPGRTLRRLCFPGTAPEDVSSAALRVADAVSAVLAAPPQKAPRRTAPSPRVPARPHGMTLGFEAGAVLGWGTRVPAHLVLGPRVDVTAGPLLMGAFRARFSGVSPVVRQGDLRSEMRHYSVTAGLQLAPWRQRPVDVRLGGYAGAMLVQVRQQGGVARDEDWVALLAADLELAWWFARYAAVTAAAAAWWTAPPVRLLFDGRQVTVFGDPAWVVLAGVAVRTW